MFLPLPLPPPLLLLLLAEFINGGREPAAGSVIQWRR